MSPLNSTFNLRPATSSRIFAGNASVPVIARAARALATACSISRCELIPTFFRNLRMLKFRASSFIEVSQCLRGGEFRLPVQFMGHRALRAACLHLRSHFLLDLCVDPPLLRSENHINPLVAFLHDASAK